MKSIILGLKRHPMRFIVSIFLSYSALWTVIESIEYFFSLSLKGLYIYIIFVFISIVIGLFRVYQPKKISIKVNTSDTTLNIYYGDIFKQDGYIAISVNEFFDSELGEPVSEKSLHGMVIKQFFGGHPESFDKAILTDLQNKSFEEIDRSIGGNNRKYPIGTTASITANEHKFLLFALCYTDISTFKANSDLPTMINALHGLFDRSRNCTGGSKLIIPLIGSGISGIGLPATQLLQLIVLTIIDETKRKQICKEIDLVLHESRFSEIDLEIIRRQWI